MADNHSAHTEVPSGGHKGAFPPFARDTFASQLVWLTITFVALYVLMAKLVLPRIGSIFKARSGQIANDLAAAQRLRDESEAALAAYEKALADARARAQGIAAETHQRLGKQAEERRKVLEGELNRRLAEADKSIATTKNAAMANVRSIAVDTASAIVERLIGSVPAKSSVEAAVEDVLKR
ncbi:MAG TPA: F0F1 ATP synthase subunit B' [Xanthobacteraceae bacterium]|jgi:F-type H+-transporting ATPase subunit b|nr:F0F1 ATP synthase subunit B' [Xanthobacteraceae bacterium]